MFGVLFVDAVCWLDEVKVEDVYFFAKIRNSDMILLLKREKNFLLITNSFFLKTWEKFDFIVVRFEAPEMFNLIAFNVALRFSIIVLHLKSGVKTKGKSSYIFLLVISTSFKQKNGEQQEHHF